MIGIDTEYVAKGDRNEVISYQWHVIVGEKVRSGIHYVDGKRMKFAHFLQKILEDAKAGGVISRYPAEVVVAAHFSLAELVAMADFPDLKKKFDGLRRTYASVKATTDFRLRDTNGNVRTVYVTLRDTMLLTPQGAGLHALGEMHGLPKIELPEGMIQHMDVLRLRDPELFERYAIRDAEIAAIHAVSMAALNNELTGQDDVPISLGGLATEFALKSWEHAGIKKNDVLGLEEVVEEVFVERLGRCLKKKKTVPRANLHENEALAVECYHGGRNEAFFFGASGEDQWSDVDLCGAYSTALAMIGMPSWDDLRVSQNVGDYTPAVIGLARIRFEFPADLRFPCVPMRADNNLIFPLTGETNATAPEIWLALKLGAKIEILHGIVIPMDFSVKPFQSVITEATQRRREATAAGDTIRDKLFKELVNSLYGKTAQGLREKRVFDTRAGSMTNIPPSKITNAFIAAYVTGIVRAVLAEAMNKIPSSREILSVTTDGFITNAGQAELAIATSGELCCQFADSRNQLVGDSTIIETKHTAKRVLCWRTRGQSSLGDLGEKPILAKAGMKSPRGMARPEQCAWILDMFEARNINSTFEFKNLRTLSKLYKQGGDLVSEDFVRRVSMDFDWKRCPADAFMSPVNSTLHLAFRTRPWNSREDFARCREQWERFRQETGRCLKTEADLRDFLEFLAGADLGSLGLQRAKAGASKVALRQFLRAYAREEWGLKRTMSYSELEKLLRSGGYNTSVTDIKNAGRANAKLVPHAVHPTGAVMLFVTYVKNHFPGFDAALMLGHEPAAEATQNAESA